MFLLSSTNTNLEEITERLKDGENGSGLGKQGTREMAVLTSIVCPKGDIALLVRQVRTFETEFVFKSAVSSTLTGHGI